MLPNAPSSHIMQKTFFAELIRFSKTNIKSLPKQWPGCPLPGTWGWSDWAGMRSLAWPPAAGAAPRDSQLSSRPLWQRYRAPGIPPGDPHAQGQGWEYCPGSAK